MNDKVTKLSVTAVSVNKQAVELAQELLSLCESGEYQSLFVVAEKRGGIIVTHGTGAESKFRVAGALLDGALMRLGYRTTE